MHMVLYKGVSILGQVLSQVSSSLVQGLKYLSRCLIFHVTTALTCISVQPASTSPCSPLGSSTVNAAFSVFRFSIYP